MNSDILALKEKLDKIKNLGWIECKNKNKSVTGKTLENLLEINPDNFEIPDYNTIEIKSKVSKRENYIDLFCATPDSYVLETKRLYDKYGYLDSNNYKILNFVLYGEFLKSINNEYSAKLRIDYKNKKVIMEVYNKDNELIDNLSSWSFELLEEKLCRKLNYVCLVEGDKKFSHNVLYVRYDKYKFYKLKKFSNFIRLLKRGQIRISFTLGVYKSGSKCGKMHDHGTQFSIRKENVKLLFDEIELE